MKVDFSTSGPQVSIVTPAFNSGRFIERTICSVLAQDYANIDYVVMDGGSTDQTGRILDRYTGRLRYVSQPDRGQADAINMGLQFTRGEICGFLNADDTYLPGAVSTVVRAFREHPNAAVVYGHGWYVDEQDNQLSAYPVEAFDRSALARRCFICQPAAFFRRDAVEAIGMLDASLQYALDYDLWIRIAEHHSMVKVDQFLATLRLHQDAKSISHTAAAMRETVLMLRRHYGYAPFNWVYGYGYSHVTGESPIRHQPRPQFASAIYALLLGARYNWRHPLRFSHDVIRTFRQGLA
jgi:glycosyltransferase involved in cell wall biosynthesis